MRIAGRDPVDEVQAENDAVSLCSLYAGEETFGIDTKKIREVLGERVLQDSAVTAKRVWDMVTEAWGKEWTKDWGKRFGKEAR